MWGWLRTWLICGYGYLWLDRGVLDLLPDDDARHEASVAVQKEVLESPSTYWLCLLLAVAFVAAAGLGYRALPSTLIYRFKLDGFVGVIIGVFAGTGVMLANWLMSRRANQLLRDYLGQRGYPICRHCGYVLTEGLPRCSECGTVPEPVEPVSDEALAG